MCNVYSMYMCVCIYIYIYSGKQVTFQFMPVSTSSMKWSTNFPKVWRNLGLWQDLQHLSHPRLPRWLVHPSRPIDRFHRTLDVRTGRCNLWETWKRWIFAIRKRWCLCETSHLPQRGLRSSRWCFETPKHDPCHVYVYDIFAYVCVYYSVYIQIRGLVGKKWVSLT